MRIASLLCAAALTAACGSSSSEDKPRNKQITASRLTPGAAEAELHELAEAYFNAHHAFYPIDGSNLGLHQYDGEVGERSKQGIADHIAVMNKLRAGLEAINAADLTRPQVLERDAVVAHIRGQLFDLDTLKKPFRDPMFYMWALGLTDYISRDYAPVADRLRGLIGVCDKTSAFLQLAQTNLAAEIPKTWLDTALLQLNGMIQFAETDVPKGLKGLDQAQKKQLNEALARYTRALGRFRDFLEARLPKATQAFALGEANFLAMLREKEGVDIDLTHLAAIARQDLARNTKAIEEAANKIDPAKDVRAVVEQVKKDKPTAGKVLEEATGQAVAMRKFLVDNKIVTIPSEDLAEVRESTPFMRWNFAFLSSAGAFETKPLPSFYYISPPDPTWPRKVQQGYIAARNDLLFVTIHEVWPGHFLHALHLKKNKSKYLTAFCSYSMSEGWAHYAEEMMWDAGVGDGDPAVHIGQLLNALLRDARFLSAIGLHTKGMTVEQSVALFETKGFQDTGAAKQQAVRGTFDPGYLNYTVGKLMIRKLREDWKAKKGASYSLQAFHDAFLSHGCAPVPVIRRSMLGDGAGPAL